MRAREGATIAALLSEKDIRLSRKPGSRTESQGERRLATGSESDILDRLDLLAEAEAARFAPSLRSRGIDPAAAHQVARLRDDLLGHAPFRPQHEAESSDQRGRMTSCSSAILLAYPDRVVKRRRSAGNGRDGGRARRLPRPRSRSCATPICSLRSMRAKIAAAGVLEAQVTLASMVRLEWLEELFPAHVRRRADDSLRRTTATSRQHEPALVSRLASSRGRDCRH